MLPHPPYDFKELAGNPCTFIDTTGWLNNLTHLGNVFYGEKGCGKSTILSMLISMKSYIPKNYSNLFPVKKVRASTVE